MKILVTPTSLQPGKNAEALETLQKFTTDLVFNSTGRPLTEDELIPLLQDCDGYIAGLDDVTAKVLAACPNLKVVSRYGAGYDRVDIQAAKEHGIVVTNTPRCECPGSRRTGFWPDHGCRQKHSLPQ